MYIWISDEMLHKYSQLLLQLGNAVLFLSFASNKELIYFLYQYSIFMSNYLTAAMENCSDFGKCGSS